MKYIATVTTICLLMVVFIFGLTAGVGSAATIELARGRDGKALVGLKVEGEIVPGDAIKLLGMYQYYGNGAASTIFLLSKGGDVEEAMTMGRLIRTLSTPIRKYGDAFSGRYQGHETPCDRSLTTST